MKITKIETFQIETPRYYQQHPVNTGEAPSGHVIVKLHVADGLVGLGEASDSKAGDLGALTKRYNDLLVDAMPPGLQRLMNWCGHKTLVAQSVTRT